MTLDVLFQQTASSLVDIEASPTVFSSLCAADVSEAHLIPAASFLDSIYSDAGFSRANTPALVRESHYIPGAFPSFDPQDLVTSQTARQQSPAVFDRLYPSLPTSNQPYTAPISRFRTSVSPSKSHTKPASNILTRSIAKLTSHLQESSFLSAPAPRRYLPRLSTLPSYPPVTDLNLHIDNNNADYAILLSMYEVHNDRIFDLLSPTTKPNSQQKRRPLLFKPTESSPDRKVVTNLHKILCSSLPEALLVLETGLQERRVAGTGTNATSSRSHGFFCFEVKKRLRSSSSHYLSVPGPWTSSTLTIVDLAGSERARTAKTAGATLAEAGQINESLMYLGQCMQMQSDNSHISATGAPSLVPFRQCKLTELLFSNSFAPASTAHTGIQHKTPQKAIMIVTADPLGDFNATSQILRYSALAREVTVPRIPSVTATLLATTAGKTTAPSGRTSPSAMQEELELALMEIARLREEAEVTALLLEEEVRRRQDVEESWRAAEARSAEIEAEVREEVCAELEARFLLEQRRWRAARDEEMDAQDEHLDAKVDLLTQVGAFHIHEDEDEGAGKENEVPCGVDYDEEGMKVGELELENEKLRERVKGLEREREGMRSPSKHSKVRVLSARRWQGSGMGVDDF